MDAVPSREVDNR